MLWSARVGRTAIQLEDCVSVTVKDIYRILRWTRHAIALNVPLRCVQTVLGVHDELNRRPILILQGNHDVGPLGQ